MEDCGNCRFWELRPITFSASSSEPGWCLRYPDKRAKSNGDWCGEWQTEEEVINPQTDEQFVSGSKTPCATCQWLCWHSRQGCTCFWPKGNRHCEYYGNCLTKEKLRD